MQAPTTSLWVCPSCRHGNLLDVDTCAGGGISFGALLGAGTEPTGARVRAVAGGVREIALVGGLFVLWKVASAVSVMDTAGAFARGRWIWHLERALRLPSEVAVQHGVLAYPVGVQALNVFYLGAHLGSLVVFLPWLFLRHREHYARWRNLLAAFTGCALLIQLISVAPPRLLPQYGFVDTAALYHQSAYQHLGYGLTGQLATVPSIHVGWAVAISAAVIMLGSSRWRWLVLLHPLLTCYAVVATANHFWIDGLAAVGLLGIVGCVARFTGRRRQGAPDRSGLVADLSPQDA
jgi:hypothetical protein